MGGGLAVLSGAHDDQVFAWGGYGSAVDAVAAEVLHPGVFHLLQAIVVERVGESLEWPDRGGEQVPEGLR